MVPVLPRAVLSRKRPLDDQTIGWYAEVCTMYVMHIVSFYCFRNCLHDYQLNAELIKDICVMCVEAQTETCMRVFHCEEYNSHVQYNSRYILKCLTIENNFLYIFLVYMYVLKVIIY